MAATAAPWLAHPMAEVLLRFDRLPSTWLHPSRAESRWFASLKGVASLHRHWSAALQREHALQPLVALDDPALPVALLPAEAFRRLMLFAGLALLAPQVRHTIAREPVAQLHKQLGADGVEFALKAAARFELPPVEHALRTDDARAECERWGASLLALAFEAASEPVAKRALLRLPARVDAALTPLTRTALAPVQALARVRELVQLLEPAWLSSFPAAR